jgi:hypothetical protein
MCCNNMCCYTDMSHCEWAVCGYEWFFGVGFIVVCRYSSVCNQIKVHTRGCGNCCILLVFSLFTLYVYSFQALYISRSLPHGLAWLPTQGRTRTVYRYRITLNKYSTWSRKKTTPFSCHYLRVHLISLGTFIIDYVDVI